VKYLTKAKGTSPTLELRLSDKGFQCDSTDSQSRSYGRQAYSFDFHSCGYLSHLLIFSYLLKVTIPFSYVKDPV